MTGPAREPHERPSRSVPMPAETTLIRLDENLSPARIRARTLRQLNRASKHRDRGEQRRADTAALRT